MYEGCYVNFTIIMKNEVCMCNIYISMERKLYRLHDGINEDKIA